MRRVSDRPAVCTGAAKQAAALMIPAAASPAREGTSADGRGVNLGGVEARTVTARLTSPAARGEGRSHMGAQTLTLVQMVYCMVLSYMVLGLTHDVSASKLH